MIDNLMIADEFLTTRSTNIILCGYCGTRKDDLHDDDACGLLDRIESRDLTWEDVLNQYPDYYADETLILDESNVTATSISKEDEWDGIFANRENNFIGRYDDVENNRCTHAIKFWRYSDNNLTHAGHYTDHHMPKPMKIRNRKTGDYSKVEFTESASYEQDYDGLDFEDPRLMRLEFNELQGFVSSRLIDLGITEKFHAKVYNVFVGSYDNKLHVGSCVISRTVDNRISATCSRKDCKATLVAPHFDDITREDMEIFIHSVIRHGNNHGPDFITKRSDFTYIHATNCDTDHEAHHGCNARASYETFMDITFLQGDDEVLDFLIKHRKVCTASDCRCTHYYHLLASKEYAA